MGDGAIDVDDMAGGTVHGGNGRLPVSRPEHVNHLEGGGGCDCVVPPLRRDNGRIPVELGEASSGEMKLERRQSAEANESDVGSRGFARAQAQDEGGGRGGKIAGQGAKPDRQESERAPQETGRQAAAGKQTDVVQTTGEDSQGERVRARPEQESVDRG